MPRRRRGEVSSWNRYLHRAVWLWSTDQVARYDHVWRDVYYHYKWQEMLAHPTAVKAENHAGKSITKFTIGHLDKRAKRKTGSALLRYVHGLWSTRANEQGVEAWFRTAWHNEYPEHGFGDDHSSWDKFLNGHLVREVKDGLYEKVKEESDRRRNREPESEDESED